MLVSCSTDQPVPSLATPGRILPLEYVSKDSSLRLRLRVNPKQSHYDLVAPATGTHLASASSAIVSLDFHDHKFCGTADVIFAKDGSGVVITEDLSDAGPCLRYILFHRLANGSFEVRYLEPPTVFNSKCPAPAYSYEHPIATELSTDQVTFYYPHVRQTKVMQLDKVPTTPTLQPL